MRRDVDGLVLDINLRELTCSLKLYVTSLLSLLLLRNNFHRFDGTKIIALVSDSLVATLKAGDIVSCTIVPRPTTNEPTAYHVYRKREGIDWCESNHLDREQTLNGN